MEPSENLSEMEAVKVLENPSIMLVWKIGSETRQNRRVKAKAANEEKMSKHLAADGPGGGNGRGGRRL
jgi:hypothetical protein